MVADESARVASPFSHESSAIVRTMDGWAQSAWSRDGKWIAVIEPPNVVLLRIEDGLSVPLRDVIPEEHFVFAAG